MGAVEITQNEFNRELFQKARALRAPLMGTFELTGRCNLACRMCYVGKDASDSQARRAELSATRWLALGRQAGAAGMLYLLLTGGEVFLRPDFFAIYEGLSKLGLQITLNTNATLITPEIACRLASFPPRGIAVSVYGASPETYRRVCGDASAYDHTLRGIHLLMEQGLPVRLRTTAIRQNRADLAAIYVLAKELGLGFRLVDYVFAGRGPTRSDPFAVRLSPPEQRRCLDQVQELAGNKKQAPVPQEDKDESEPVEEQLQPQLQGSAFQCSAGHYSFAVHSDGHMSACLLLEQPGLPLEGSFVEGWTQLKERCDAVPVCSDCAVCDLKQHCRVCPAKCKGETGSFRDKPLYLCRMAELAAQTAYSQEGMG